MKQLLKGSVIPAMVVCFAIGCKKSPDESNSPESRDVQHATNSTQIVPYPVTPAQECSYSPYYGDSIVFPQPFGATDYYVYPQSNQGIEGSYLSWPQGLSIDTKTGIIDLTQSETGQRYSIGFVKSGSTDTCISQLIIGGVSYLDSVYVLANSDTTSVPYFNANPNVPSPCGSNTGPGKGCQFDYNDYAKFQGIIVDKKSGFIDLKKTTEKINFATLINGQSMVTRIYYKLNDQSNNAPQMIELKLVYYKHRSDIPPDVLSQISENIYNTMNNLLVSKGPSTRPPIIIIVRSN